MQVLGTAVPGTGTGYRGTGDTGTRYGVLGINPGYRVLGIGVLDIEILGTGVLGVQVLGTDTRSRGTGYEHWVQGY